VGAGPEFVFAHVGFFMVAGQNNRITGARGYSMRVPALPDVSPGRLEAKSTQARLLV
jgi:hypothetical protein